MGGRERERRVLERRVELAVERAVAVHAGGFVAYVSCDRTKLRHIGFENEREIGGEPVADLRVRGGRLTGVDVPAERAPAPLQPAAYGDVSVRPIPPKPSLLPRPTRSLPPSSTPAHRNGASCWKKPRALPACMCAARGNMCAFWGRRCNRIRPMLPI